MVDTALCNSAHIGCKAAQIFVETSVTDFGAMGNRNNHITIRRTMNFQICFVERAPRV